MKFKTVFFLNMNTITNKESNIMLKKKQQRNRYRKKNQEKLKIIFHGRKTLEDFQNGLNKSFFVKNQALLVIFFWKNFKNVSTTVDH